MHDHSIHHEPKATPDFTDYREEVTDAEVPPPAEDQPAVPSRPRPAKWKATLVIVAILAIQIGNWVASASIFALLAKHPMWLLLLQPTTKNLLLVASQIAVVPFFVVAILRRQIPHPLWFLIGRWYGESGIRWIKKRSPDIGMLVETLEAWFPKWGWLICLIYPHPVVCAMAGASTMRFVPFLIYTFIGIIGYVWAAHAFGDWLSPVTTSVTHFGSDRIIPLTILTVVITAFGLWQGNRNDKSKFESVHQIEQELEGDTDTGDDSKS